MLKSKNSRQAVAKCSVEEGGGKEQEIKARQISTEQNRRKQALIQITKERLH